MVAYNFRAQFADAVASGAKRQTIRRRRKRPTRPGDALQLYTDLRTHKTRKLRDAVCVAIDRFDIDEEMVHTFERNYGIDGSAGRGVAVFATSGRLVVSINGVPLLAREIRAVAIADGFTGANEFLNFFIDHYGLPFSGEIIKW